MYYLQIIYASKITQIHESAKHKYNIFSVIS